MKTDNHELTEVQKEYARRVIGDPVMYASHISEGRALGPPSRNTSVDSEESPDSYKGLPWSR